jgi:hypothetical protein
MLQQELCVTSSATAAAGTASSDVIKNSTAAHRLAATCIHIAKGLPPMARTAFTAAARRRLQKSPLPLADL